MSDESPESLRYQAAQTRKDAVGEKRSRREFEDGEVVEEPPSEGAASSSNAPLPAD